MAIPITCLFNPSTSQTVIWYMSGATCSHSAYGPTLPDGYTLVATADMNGDGYPDYILYNSTTRETFIWYLNNNSYVSSDTGPVLPIAGP